VTTPIAPFAFDNTYAREMEGFYADARPAPARTPRLVAFNPDLVLELGLDLAALDDGALDSDLAARLFTGAELPEGSSPIAQVYAGHQFGHFVPQLGDGRALLLGEVIDAHGRRRDVQLKGSGPTRYSRGGDGLAALGPVLREYLVSEAMAALGVPTTRSLAAATTGESVFRDGPLPGAVLTRVASSHLRVGTFQYFSARGEVEQVRKLADYAIARHDPHLAEVDPADRYLEFLAAVRDRQAALIAGWMAVGFIHGVMNTDNTTISGETIDYGPCAFLDAYDPATVFSSIDLRGRYAFSNQPPLAAWNLARFAEALLPLFDPDLERAAERAIQVVEEFGPRYEEQWLACMRAKLGLSTDQPEDHELVESFHAAMHAGQVDFTGAFRMLAAAAAGQHEPLRELFAASPNIDAWLARWTARTSQESTAPADRATAMSRVNPLYIPRNHKLEQALDAAVDRGDLAPFEELLALVTRPFDDQPGKEVFTQPAPPDAPPFQTFCGT
jgi:uncharacterized protein YdiU (UPF0061 family)